MTTEHTPGPWAADGRGGTISAARPACSDVVTDRVVVCEAWSGDSIAEAAANRRLVAAAPELLDALWAMATSFHDVEWMDPHKQIAARMARAAIAKATGGAA